MVGATSVPPMLPSTSCQLWFSSQAELERLSEPRGPRMPIVGATRQMLVGIAAWPEASVYRSPASIRDDTCPSANCGISIAADNATYLARKWVMRPLGAGVLHVLSRGRLVCSRRQAPHATLERSPGTDST